ncbi:MAG TPA: HAMP domain-containing sensor histidine kinase [Rhizomicrobium sp.]|nr:HAMP domain-containing sensor histidine kinase [Rhizomicrobium sp.]
MAGQTIAARPLLHGALSRLAALPTRNIRATVLLCVIAIGGAFAAAGALQMRFERAQAYQQAAFFEARRAGDIAAVVHATLARQERAGRRFAAGEMFSLPPDVRGIAVADATGALRAASGEPVAIANLVRLAEDGRVVLATPERAVIAFHRGLETVAVSFDCLAPPEMLENAQLTGTGGHTLAGSPLDGGTATAPVSSWPVQVRVAVENSDAPAAWYGSLPLYLFVILGPAVVGAWLAVVFVGEFERRARASRAIRALRSIHPAEARLLVRLANAERQAAESARSKTEFIAHMSHELRTPLNAIIGFAEVIERGFYGPVGHRKYIEYARDIGLSGRHLHGKITDILEFADLEAGRYPLRPVDFDVAELVGACVSESAGRAFGRRIALHMLPAAPAQVQADPMAVRRIMMNLLSNALIYTPEGGRVRVAVREEEGAIAVTVSDSGGGFTADERADAGTAFRRFERVGVSTGTGLGLAIVVALARRMGGALVLSGATNEGTSAELRLRKAEA